MKSLSLSLAIFAGCLCLASIPAHADVGPGPYVPPRPRPNHAVLQWFKDADAAIAAKKAPAFEALCEARGFTNNLVGATGVSLKAFFDDVSARGLRLVPDQDSAHYVNFGEPGQRKNAVILGFELRERASEVVVEKRVMLIQHAGPITNAHTWRALAVGHDRKEMASFARREFPREVLKDEILR